MISVEEELPTAEDLDGECGERYIIWIEGFTPQLALFLVSPTGECGWYKDYTAKIIRPVTHWMKVE